LDALRSVNEVEGPDEFAVAAMACVRRLVPCEVVSFNEVDPAAGRLAYLIDPVDFPSPPEGPEALASLALQNPLIAHVQATGDGSARRTTDCCTLAEFKSREVYRRLYGPMGIDYQLSITLPAPLPMVVGLVANRAAVDFTDREVALFDALRPHLAHTWRTARDQERLRTILKATSGSARADLGAIELSDPPAELTAGALVNLYRFFGRPGEHDPLPPRVSRWVSEHRRQPPSGTGGYWPDARTAASRALELSRPLIGRLGQARVAARLLPAGDGHSEVLLMQAVPVSPARRDLRALGLSEREAEVLRAVASGHNNSALAAQLGIGVETVKTHLAHIYSKLGVSGRVQAVALLSEILAHHGQNPPSEG
jgi:DNA-binding CsgD family transcriptional regulator